LGDPPRTIAVRTRDALLIAYPRLKRVEKIALENGLDSKWRYVMALLDVGFPQDPETFLATYNLTGSDQIDDRWLFDLQPASQQARWLLDSIRLEISVPDMMLQATQLAFPDGSIMRNEFHNIVVNPDVQEGLFDFEIPKDYQVVNPLAGSREH
jgi:outer membrane lipoprotein-sorting protein